ncbi:MAG: hypothetical protein WDN49_23865 [Acetobacteraceae bacterium]
MKDVAITISIGVTRKMQTSTVTTTNALRAGRGREAIIGFAP